MLSYTLDIIPLKKHKLDIELNPLFDRLLKNNNKAKINHISIAYGVWARVSMKGRKFTSKLNVDEFNVTSNNMNEYSSTVLLNDKALIKTDTELAFGYIYKKDKIPIKK